jgi:hypothetical protein
MALCISIDSLEHSKLSRMHGTRRFCAAGLGASRKYLAASV